MPTQQAERKRRRNVYVTWQGGRQTLNGYRALQYVRTRHGLVDGDFDRGRLRQYVDQHPGSALSSSKRAGEQVLEGSGS